MKKFVLMHCGFKMPTPEIMQAWNDWFASIADQTVENIGFGSAREITAEGAADLPWGPDSITGLSIVEAESLEAAEKMAASNPFVKSIRIYEMRGH